MDHSDPATAPTLFVQQEHFLFTQFYCLSYVMKWDLGEGGTAL